MLDTPSLHILVIEDNDNLRDATIDFLNTSGHSVEGIASAEEIDETPTRDLPDLYLIDINLPGENGFELAQRIRKSQPLAGIILITARGQLSDRLEGYSVGVDNYLTKPIDRTELLACINTLARRLKTNSDTKDFSFHFDKKTMLLSGPKAEILMNYGESKLLVALNRAAGRKLERWQAMQLIDVNDKGLLPANLEMRISALRKKLTASGAPEDAIITLRGFGYGLTIEINLN